MTKEIFIEKLISMLDRDGDITMDTVLSDMEEWDSLSLVSFMAMANVECGKKISPLEVKAANLVQDLYRLIEE